MKITRKSKLGLALGGLALFLTACGGGGGGDGSGVASLAADADQAAASADDGPATEEEVLAWVECMREQGLDIADPTVDADGNLVLGRGPRGGGAAGGATAGTPERQPIDRDTFSKAGETCGNPPQTGGGFSEEDRQATQDSMLAMAQCLRDEGLDVADPDFSSQGPGGAPVRANGAGGDADQPRGIFGGLDMNDAKVQAAFDTCRDELGTNFPGGPGGARGSAITSGGNN
jgi:hypothetical protein